MMTRRYKIVVLIWTLCCSGGAEKQDEILDQGHDFVPYEVMFEVWNDSDVSKDEIVSQVKDAWDDF